MTASSGWPAGTLGSVATFYAGSSLPEGELFNCQHDGFLLARVSDMNQQGNEILLQRALRWSASPGAKSATCPPGSLVIPKRGGAIGTNKKRITNRPCILDPNLMAIWPHPGVLDIRFLYHWFLNFDLTSIANGSSVPQLNKKDLWPLLLPLPPIEHQQRIAAVLDEACALREKRSVSARLLDNLAQAIFIDMFGNPVGNDRSWPWAKVGDFVYGFESGKSIASSPDEPDGGYRILKVSAVTTGAFNPAESKPAPTNYSPPSSHIVHDGDLLFSRANTSELVGATAFASDPPANLLLPDKLWRFNWHSPSRADPMYVHYLFGRPEFRDVISRNATGSSGSMKNISQAKVLAISCGLPPLDVQQEFGRRIEHVNGLRRSQTKHLVQLNSLFAALQHRAFNGELSSPKITDESG